MTEKYSGCDLKVIISADDLEFADIRKGKAQTASSEEDHSESFNDIRSYYEAFFAGMFGVNKKGSCVLSKDSFKEFCIQPQYTVSAASVSPNAWKEPTNNRGGDMEPIIPTNPIVAKSPVEKPSQDSSCLKKNMGEASSPQGPLKASEASLMAIEEPKCSKKCLKVPDIRLQNEMKTSESINPKYLFGPTTEDYLLWKSPDKDDRQPVKEVEAKKFTMLQRTADSKLVSIFNCIMSAFNRCLRNISLKHVVSYLLLLTVIGIIGLCLCWFAANGIGLAKGDRVGDPERIGRGGLGSRGCWDHHRRCFERFKRSNASFDGFLELSVGESIDYTFPHPLNNTRNGKLCEFKIFRGTTNPDNICYYSLLKKNYRCLLGGVSFKRTNNEITVSFQNVTSRDTSLYIIHRSDICGGDITFQMKVLEPEATTTTKTASTAIPSSAVGVYGNWKIWAAFIIPIIWLQHAY